MKRVRLLAWVALIGLITAASYFVTSVAEEPTPAAKPAPAASSQTPAAAPQPCCGEQKPASKLTEPQVRTCPLYCFAEIVDGDGHKSYYYYAIEYLYTAGTPPTCEMQGMGMMILDGESASWNDCSECPGGSDDKKADIPPKAKLGKKVKDAKSLKPTVDEVEKKKSTEVGEFYVEVSYGSNLSAVVLVKLFVVSPEHKRTNVPRLPTRIVAVGAELERDKVPNGTKLLRARNVVWASQDQRVHFEVDGIKVEALLAP